jgi:hypothetical protein
MPGPIFAVEWPNANSQRKYPLAEDATGVDESSSFTIPNDFLLDLVLPVRVDTDVEPDLFFIRNITSTGLGFSVTLAYNNGDAEPPIVGTALISRTQHVEGNSYAIPGVNNYDDTIGSVSIGLLDTILDQPAGSYDFDYAGGKLDQHTIRPNIRGVSSLRVVNNGELSARVSGHVELVAGTHMRITPIFVEGQDPKIRFDMVNGEGLIVDCSCDQDTEEGGCIRAINSVQANNYGELELIGNNCLSITTIENGLNLEDTCSSPCCGCVELERITEDLSQFGNQVVTLQNFINRLETVSTQFSNTVLGSRLSDNGCVDCT